MTDVTEQAVSAELVRLAEAGKRLGALGWGYREVRRIDAWSAFFVWGPEWICITGTLPDFSAYPDGITNTVSHALLAIAEGLVVERLIEPCAASGNASGYVYSLMGAKSGDDRETILLDGYEEIGLAGLDGEWPVVDVTQPVARLVGRTVSI